MSRKDQNCSSDNVDELCASISKLCLHKSNCDNKSNCNRRKTQNRLEITHKEENKTRIFHARPVPLTTYSSNIKLMENKNTGLKKNRASEKNTLNTQSRAEKRKKFEDSLKEKERKLSIIKKQEETEKRLQEQSELLRLRAATVFKARPIRKYK